MLLSLEFLFQLQTDDMKLNVADMANYQDEFDVYFVRAKLDETLAQEQAAMNQMSRRGSMYSNHGSNNTIEVPSHHRRALSCKLPSTTSRRRRSRSKGSRSPRNTSPPGKTPQVVEVENGEASEALLNGSEKVSEGGLEISMNYVRESTLRAPSPRVGGSTPKSHSAPHSRTCSYKNRSRSGSFRNSDGAAAAKRGSDSSPSERSHEGSVQFENEVARKLDELRLLQAEDVCIVRNFQTSIKGRLINRGDSFKRRPQHQPLSASASSASVPPVSTSVSSDIGVAIARQQSVASETAAPAITAIHETSVHTNINKILVVGDHGVGKTALLQQFMTSDYMAAMETYGKSLKI